MLTQHNYEKLETDNWEPKIKECCDKGTSDDPRGCDCCYDHWLTELQEVKIEYGAAEAASQQLKNRLSVVKDRRDKLKIWYDELTNANDLARNLCDQLEILLTQTKKIADNTEWAVKAIKTLYCMIRDFYMQIDLINSKYDQLINCINCLKTPAFAPGQGIMKCLEEYGKKLESLIATRDQLTQALMVVIKIACRINKNLEKDYGLYTVITEWKATLKCDIPCAEEDEPCDEDDDDNENEKVMQGKQADSCLGDCKLDPIFLFPICKDPYYKCLDEQYKTDKAEAEKLEKQLLEENKKKESLLACKQSLEAAIKEVDPKLLCK